MAGEGDARAALMIVGEQPGGDTEQGGRPFIGSSRTGAAQPSGRSRDRSARVWLANAVKHFKFEPRGKHRFHQDPTAREIDICRWWIESERLLVRPRLILALGASAARSLLGRTVSVQRVRGEAIMLEDEAELWITTHPPYLLRLKDDARELEEQRFAADLGRLAARLRDLAPRA